MAPEHLRLRGACAILRLATEAGHMRAPIPVTTTDLLKLAGLSLVLVDHYGLFFDATADWWRVAGRGAAPVFFFLIGFARTRNVPWMWIILGTILTALDAFTANGLEDVSLNILFNFALIRLVSPWIERHVLPLRWGLPALAMGCVALIPVAGVLLEYGASGWLWALLGLAVREALVSPEPHVRRLRNMVATITLSAYVISESVDFQFDAAQTAALFTLMAALTAVFLHFRRADAPWRIPAPLSRGLHWIGRRSLEIYAISLFAMQSLGYAFDIGFDDDEEDES